MARASSLIGGPLSGALDRNRERLNARVAAMRLAGKTVDPDALLCHLKECVVPVIEAVSALDEASVDRVAVALFELSLEIVASDLRARAPEIQEAWRVLLPAHARTVRYDARRIAGAITNAVIAIRAARGASVERWISSMASIADSVTDSRTFLDAGRVAAWRAGVAHLRTVSLERVPLLDGAILEHVFGVEAPDARDLAGALTEDRWLDPARPSKDAPTQGGPVARVGGFRGFGSEFLTPPLVGSLGGRLIARSGDSAWEVHVDAFGAGLTPVPDNPPFKAGGVEPAWKRLPGVVEPASAVAVDRVIAVTLRYSHSILLFAA